MQNKTFDWAQFEIKETSTVDNWLKKISINSNSRIIEIGSGKGAITQRLANIFASILALDIDPENIKILESKFKESKNVTVLNQDFLKYDITDKDYHIISNPPFNISRKILIHITTQKFLSKSWHLMLQKEVALKITKKDKEHNSLSAFLNSFYEMKCVADLKRDDFRPSAHVSVSTVSAHLKELPSILSEPAERLKYLNFIDETFNKSNRPLKNRLKGHLSNLQIKKLCSDLSINPEGSPFQLSSENWIALFKFIKSLNKTL